MPIQYLSPNLDKVVYETIDDEVIIINLETGSYYSIVGSGAIIWSAVEQGVEREQLVEGLAGYFEGDRASIISSVNTFVEALLAEEIITLTSQNRDSETSLSLPGEPSALTFAAPTLSIHTNMSDLLLLDPIHDVDEQGWPSQPPQ